MGSADESLIPVVAELENGTTGSSLFTYSWKGQEKELSFRTLRNTMYLAVTAPVSEIDAARNELVLHILTALVLISALSVGLTVLFTRRLIRPLKELNTAAKKIAEGDYSVSISNQTKDEVGTLAESFQKTVDSLQKYITYINGLAYRDPLTGVKNKTAYQEAERQMEERMRTGQPEFAVVVMDINGLKTVNDTCGHDFGDILIIDACKLICRTFKRSPVYRIGGDELWRSWKMEIWSITPSFWMSLPKGWKAAPAPGRGNRSPLRGASPSMTVPRTWYLPTCSNVPTTPCIKTKRL